MAVQVKVSARHGHLDETMQRDITEKAGKLLHYFERVTLIEVTIDLRGDVKKAEVLLNAHRELEKLVLTPRQQRVKEGLALSYGDWVHEGQLLDPVCRDIEALLLSSQQRVSGVVHLLFRPGTVFVEGVESPYSLMSASRGVYGESAGEWTSADALGFSKIAALTGVFHRRAGELAAPRAPGAPP